MTTRTQLEILAALIAAGVIWYFATPKPAPVNEWTPAKPTPQLAAVPTEEIKPPEVKVYAPPAKKKLDLPPSLQDDPNLYVLSTARLPSDTRRQDVTTLINKETGETETFVRREPSPWLAAEQNGELRLDYGYKNGMFRAGRLSLREDLVQIKALHLGVHATLDTDGQFFAGAGVGWRW